MLKGEELARKEFRSRRKKLGEVEMAAGDRNVNLYRHLAAIDREIRAMQEIVWPASPAWPAMA